MNVLRRRPSGEGGGGIPSWIVSFTDMTTLLLSFFIMLQAMATHQDASAKFLSVQGGFRRAIDYLGIPDWLLGQHERVDLGNVRTKHPMEEDPENLDQERVIDTEDEKIRKVFDDLRHLAETKATNDDGPPPRLLTTPIAFQPSDATLDAQAKEFLLDLVTCLKQPAGGRTTVLQVIGLAPDESDPTKQWLLSAERAKAAGTFLAAAIDADARHRGARVDFSGAGSGGRWRLAAGKGPGRAYVLIAVTEATTKE